MVRSVRGKTMLMDLMIEASAPLGQQSASIIRLSWPMCMSARIASAHKVKSGVVKDRDSVPPIADEIAKETQLLCLDEFAVTDIADAMDFGAPFHRAFRKQGSCLSQLQISHPTDFMKAASIVRCFCPSLKR
jgi:cell division protein ZapE